MSSSSTGATAAQQKISLSSLADLKSTTDDAIPQILCSFPAPYTFRQQHYVANVRLALGYAALAIAGALFYADWKLGGWEVTKPYTLPACAVYFILNTALSYWIWAVDRGTVFSGVLTTMSDGEQRELTLRSSVKKHDPTYHLHITYTTKGKTKVYQDQTVHGRFSQWFNMHGYLDRPALKNWLAENIDVVAAAVAVEGVNSKKEKATRSSSSSSPASSTPAIVVDTSTTTSTGADVTKKGGKARKKA